MTDTTSLKVDIPAGVTNVRAESNADFPSITVDKDVSGNVTAITWAKTNGGLDADTNFYKVAFRAKMPAAPFTKTYFKAHQKCKAPGKDAEWTGVPGDGSGNEAAPEVLILPVKTSGWNKLTVPAALTTDDLKAYFKDAQIVWKGTSAFSANAVTADQIAKEPGVTVLTDTKATSSSSSSGHTSPYPTCNETIRACHPFDVGEGTIHDCHDQGHEAHSDADCIPVRDMCLSACQGAAADAGAHDASVH